MHDNKLEVPYEYESDDNVDGEVNNTINNEFDFRHAHSTLAGQRENGLRVLCGDFGLFLL